PTDAYAGHAHLGALLQTAGVEEFGGQGIALGAADASDVTDPPGEDENGSDAEADEEADQKFDGARLHDSGLYVDSAAEYDGGKDEIGAENGERRDHHRVRGRARHAFRGRGGVVALIDRDPGDNGAEHAAFDEY